MNRVLLRSVAACGLFALVAPLSGCTADDDSLSIIRMVFTGPDTDCVVDPTNIDTRDRGLFDVGLLGALSSGDAIDGYYATPVVQNNIITATSLDGVDRDAIDVSAFEVELQPDIGQAFPSFGGNPPTLHFKTSSAVGVIASGGINQRAASVNVLPFDQALVFKGVLSTGGWNNRVIAHMRALGDHSGNAVVSNWFDYPIDLCDLCLADPNQSCAGVTPPTAATTCSLYQDHESTCCCVKSKTNFQTDCDPANIRCGTSIPTQTPGT